MPKKSIKTKKGRKKTGKPTAGLRRSPKKTKQRVTVKKKSVRSRITSAVAKKKTSQKKQPLRKTAGLVQPLISYPTLPLPKIQKDSIPVSRHLLDLRNIPKEEQRHKQPDTTLAQGVFGSLFKKQEIFAQGKKVVAKFMTSLQPAQQQTPELHVPDEFKHIFKTHQTPQRFALPKLPQLRISHFSFALFPAHWKRMMAGFAAILLLSVTPIHAFGHYSKLSEKKTQVLKAATQALDQLQATQAAFSEKDFADAESNLSAAASLFRNAQSELNSINVAVQGIIAIIPSLSKQYASAKDILKIGELVSASGVRVSRSLEAATDPSRNVTDKIADLKATLGEILPLLKEASERSETITTDTIPQEYVSKIHRLKKVLPVMYKSANTTYTLSDFLLEVLGQEHTRRYLLVFQNNNELRPTGGFIGSIALVDIDRGMIKKVEIPAGGSYDLQGTLTKNIKPPYALRPIADRWEFQDANYFPDFPTSARKLMWFYEQSGGPSVDGVLAINASLLEDILGIIGPIEMEKYGITVTAENFFDVIQTEVEFGENKSLNKPKEIIADLAPEILQRLLNADGTTVLGMLDVLQRALDTKDIQLYFNAAKTEQTALDNNWGGALAAPDGDYLNIVSTNVAGGKTDAVTHQYAELDAEIQPDGSIINTLKITKTHEGDGEGVFTSIPNVDYVRIYVPLGSELLSVSGFNPPAANLFQLQEESVSLPEDPDLRDIRLSTIIDEATKTEQFTESGKTVFANWLITGVGESRTAVITYRLPFTVAVEKDSPALKAVPSIESGSVLPKAYSLLVQKQSGKRNASLTVRVHAPEQATLIWQHPAWAEVTDTTLSISTKQIKDIVVGLLFK